MVATLAGCGSTDPTPPPSATAVVPVTPAAATPKPTSNPTPSSSTSSAPPATSQPAISGGWRSVPAQASVQGVHYQHIIWTGTRFVASGDAPIAGSVFLDSDDGVTWNQQATMAIGSPAALAAGPRGVVAVGTIGDRLASWASPEGLTWTSHAGGFPTPSTGPDVVEITGVVATDTGWLAVGRRDGICTLNCGLAPLGAIVWTSTDGLRWTRVADQAAFSKSAMTGVTRLGSTFVAVGFTVRRAVVWTSTNGTTWTRDPDAPLFHPRSSKANAWTEMTGVTASDGLIVAIGMDAESLCQDVCGRSVRAWWSTDGKTWTKGTSADFLDSQAFSVSATPTGYLAAGPSGSDRCVGGIWASGDGRAWSCAATDPEFRGFAASAAAGSPSDEVVVGHQDDPAATDGAPGAVWWRPVR